MQTMKPSTMRLIRRFASRDADFTYEDRAEFVTWHREMRRMYGSKALRDQDLRNEFAADLDGSQKHCPRCGHVGLFPREQAWSRSGVLIEWCCANCGMGGRPMLLQLQETRK